MGVKPHVRFQVDTTSLIVAFPGCDLPMYYEDGVERAGVAASVPGGTIGRVYQARLLLNTANLFSWTTIVLLSWVCERLFLKRLLLRVPGHSSVPCSQNRLRPQTSKVPVRFVHTVLGYPATSGHAAPVTVSKSDGGVGWGRLLVLQDASGFKEEDHLPHDHPADFWDLSGREAEEDIALIIAQEPPGSSRSLPQRMFN